jgi:hypothetical protein
MLTIHILPYLVLTWMIRASPTVINLYVPMYVGAEFVGGILGTVGTWIADGSLAREVALLAATIPPTV